MSTKALLFDLSLTMKDENAHLLQELSGWLEAHSQRAISPHKVQQHLDLAYPLERIERYTSTIQYRLANLVQCTVGNNAPSLEAFSEVYQGMLEQQLDRYLSNQQIQNALADLSGILIAVNPMLVFRTEHLCSYPIIYVSDARSSHYLKPSLHYFAELLARSTLEPDEVLFVHEDSNALQLFHQLGIETWNVRGGKAAGASSELLLYPDAVRAQLEANISALYGLLNDVDHGEWQSILIPNEWTIAQNVAHLIEKEIYNYRPLILKMLQDSDTFITEYATSLHPAVDPLYKTSPIAMLNHLLRERTVTVSLLQNLDDGLWERAFQHSVFGTTTLIEMVYFMAQHDRMHLRQICQLLHICV